MPGRPEVCIIRNSHLDPTYEAVKNRFLPILGRSIESIVRTQGIGELYRIYLQTCRDGLDFNLAYIPSDSTAESEGSVDAEYMEKLFAWPSTSPMRATLGRRRRTNLGTGQLGAHTDRGRVARTFIHVSWEQTNLLAYLRFGFLFVQLICMFWMTALVVQHAI